MSKAATAAYCARFCCSPFTETKLIKTSLINAVLVGSVIPSARRGGFFNNEYFNYNAMTF